MQNLKEVMRYMTYFNPPISNKIPSSVCSLEQLYDLIVNNPYILECTERVHVELETGGKEAYRKAKTFWLPMVTPMGVFSYASMKGLISLNGLGVLDYDGLGSYEEAVRLRDELFNDEGLKAELAFVSPSKTGVKVFIPYTLQPEITPIESFRTAMKRAWEYVEALYGLKADEANIDLCRGCLICHDEGAKIRLHQVDELKPRKGL